MTLTILLLSLLTVLTNSSVYSGDIKVVTGIIKDIAKDQSRLKEAVKSILSLVDTTVKNDTPQTKAKNFFHLDGSTLELVVPSDFKEIKGETAAIKAKVAEARNNFATAVVQIYAAKNPELVDEALKTVTSQEIKDIITDPAKKVEWSKKDGSQFLLKVGEASIATNATYSGSELEIVLKKLNVPLATINLVGDIMGVIPEIPKHCDGNVTPTVDFCGSGTSSSTAAETILKAFSAKLLAIKKALKIELKDEVGANFIIDGVEYATDGLKLKYTNTDAKAEQEKKYIPFDPKDTKDFAAIATLLAKAAGTKKDNTDAVVKAYNDAATAEAKITTSVVQQCGKETQTTVEKMKQPMVLAPMAAVGGALAGTGITYLVTRPSETSTTESSTQTESAAESAE